MIRCCRYEQQEVVGALVTHVGSSDSNEVDQALGVLDQLVRKHPTDMEPFFIFLKGMLDYIDNLASQPHILSSHPFFNMAPKIVI